VSEATDKWLRDMRLVEDALFRAGISVLGCGGRVWALASRVVPGTRGPSRWKAVVHRTTYDGSRYVIRVACRKCGHQLRINQRMWQSRHEDKCWSHRETS